MPSPTRSTKSTKPKRASTGKCKTSPIRMSAAHSRDKAMELRLKGWHYRDIAKAIGLSLARTYDAVSEGLAALNASTQEKATEVRQLETDRLDIMLKALGPKIAQGDTTAITTALRIQERRSKLWGLDQKDEESSLEKALAALLTQPAATDKDTDDDEDA